MKNTLKLKPFGATRLRLTKLVVAAAGALTLSTAFAQVIVVAPPPPRVEVIPQARPGVVWDPGHWQMQRGSYVWIPGHWRRVRVGYRWAAGHWVQRGPNWIWIEGHWTR